MSPEADVLEMQSLFEKLAEMLVPRGKDIECVRAIYTEFRTAGKNGNPLFTWNRVHELLKGRARRVDGFEKDNVKQRLAAIAALREGEHADAVRRSQEKYRTLEARIAALEAYFQAGDEEFGREFVDGFRASIDGQGQGFDRSGTGNGPVRSATHTTEEGE